MEKENSQTQNLNTETEASNINPNMELESIEGDSKKLIAKAALAVGGIIVLMLMISLFKGGLIFGNKEKEGVDKSNDRTLLDSTKSNENEFKVDDKFNKNEDDGENLIEDSNLIDSVKNNQDFTMINDNQGNILDLANNGNNSKDNEKPRQSLSAETKTRYPRIVKGMGVAVVSQKVVEDKENGKSPRPISSDVTAQLNGGTPDMNKIMSDIYANMPQIDADGNVIAKKEDTAQVMGETFTPTAAYFSEFNSSLLLPKGAFIPCSLKTRLVSELKGGIACIVANDIYSANGNTLLIEKGSTITGTYSNADLNDGSKRLYVIWQEIKTPNNIVIPVASSASDTLGGAGIEGYVDKHYVERFGAAIMLSVIDGSIKLLTNYVRGLMPNQNGFQVNEANQMASMVLRQSMNIKPTLYRNHGDLVGVYVNKDIDFSKVYKLKLRNKK